MFFLEPIDNIQTLLFPVQRLLDELCVFLIARQLHCSQLQWTLIHGNKSYKIINVNLTQAQSNKKSFLSISRIQFENLSLAQYGVHTLALQTKNLQAATTQTQSLFDRQHKEPIDSLLDKLQAKLGRSNAYHLDCLNEHQPELASSSRTLSATAPPALKKTAQMHKQRPSWLLPQAIPIQCRQKTLYWRGSITLLQGPERIETRWWEQASQRDYYVAQHENSSVFWVYFDIPSRRWYLHGLFS